jgi:hypothetical protein
VSYERVYVGYLCEPSVRACVRARRRNLDSVIEDLSTNFAEGTEYYSVLGPSPPASTSLASLTPRRVRAVKVFQGVFQGERQAHLKNFYAIGA